MTDIVGNSFKLVNKVTSGIRLRYLNLGPEHLLRDLGTINSSGTVSLFKKDGSILEISEADFNKDKFIYSNADGKIYYKHNGTNVELKARRIPGINWGDLVFNGTHLKIKNKLDQLFASGKVILGEPAGNRREVRYRQDPNNSTFDPIGELESNGEVGTFENIGNNHSPGDVLLEYTADGEMAIVQNGNAKTIKVCGCLAAGTTIATPSGPVSIEQLQAGDNILSPAQNGQMTIATITQIVESAAVKMMRIFSGGSYMDLTQGHPVFSPALGHKISVDSLRTGMSLLALSGLLLTVDSVAAVHYPTPVYDLQTDAGRGYFAGVEELLVSSNQCNLYLSGRNFNASQIETIEEAVSTSIEAFISDLEHSADLLEFFRVASGDVLRGRAEAWRVLRTAGKTTAAKTVNCLRLFSKLEASNLVTLRSNLLAGLSEIKLIEFGDDFGETIVETLQRMNDDVSIFNYWKAHKQELLTPYVTNTGNIPNVATVAGHFQGSPQITALINAVDAAPLPSSSQFVMAGCQHPSLPNSYQIKYNFPSAGAEYQAFLNSCHPLLKDRIKYMDMIRNDYIKNGISYQHLSNIDILTKLRDAGEAGRHAELQSLSETLYRIEQTENMAPGTFPKSRLSEVSIFVKNKNGNVMQRCPCCFHGSHDHNVNMINLPGND